MTFIEILELLEQHHALAIVIIILSLVEIAPIKVSPLKWFGKRLNTDLNEKIKDLDERVKKTEDKLDQHVAQSYRNKILAFQDDILAGKPKTKEQYKEVVNAITCYNVYCEDNEISNGLCVMASAFINDNYKMRLRNRDFAPDLKGGNENV